MASVVPWIRALHVLSVVVALGANATYGLWLATAARGTDSQLAWVLRCLQRVDSWLANGAWWAAFVSGALLVFTSGLDPTTPWLLVSVGLFLTAMVIAHAFYTPVLRRQIAVLESEGSGSPQYARVARRGQVLGIVMFALALVVFGLMVFRPALR